MFARTDKAKFIIHFDRLAQGNVVCICRFRRFNICSWSKRWPGPQFWRTIKTQENILFRYMVLFRHYFRWTLNGREISSDGTVFTKTADITRFWHSNEQSVEDELYKELEFTYSINTQGLVECHASYNTGNGIIKE